MPTASSLAWKTSLRKVRTLWHCSRLRAWRCVDRGDIRQAIDRCSDNLGFTAGRWLWSVRALELTAWLQNSKKRAERSERLMYEQSHRDYLRSLVICIIVCLSWAVNHYRDNITYKAQRDKMRKRTEAGERGNYWHADASAWCCCARYRLKS